MYSSLTRAPRIRVNCLYDQQKKKIKNKKRGEGMRKEKKKIFRVFILVFVLCVRAGPLSCLPFFIIFPHDVVFGAHAPKPPGTQKEVEKLV